jgi:putative DNA primase/helicase
MASEFRGFLEALFAGKPDDLHILLWTLPEKESRWFQTVEDAIQYAESRANLDLYVGVGLSKENCGTHSRCISKDVAGIVGLWADFDLKSEAHPDKALPATVADALQIIPKEIYPTLLVKTGNGLHGWWLFREPWIFDDDADRATAVSPITRWSTLLRLKAAAHGWAFEAFGPCPSPPRAWYSQL